MCLAFKKGLSRSLKERSLDIGRALKSETLVQSWLEDLEQMLNNSTASDLRGVLKPLDIEVKKNLEYAGDK
jgi:hypothetical protein